MDNQYINSDTRFMTINKSTLKAMGIALDLFLSDYCSRRVSGSTVSVTHPRRPKINKVNRDVYMAEYLIKAPGLWKKRSINHVLVDQTSRQVKAIRTMISRMERQYNIKVLASFNRYGPDSPTHEYNVNLMVYASKP